MSVIFRIILGTVGLLFLAGYVAWRWKRAGVMSEAMERERFGLRRSFSVVQQDPLFGRVAAFTATRGYPVSFAPVQDPRSYQVVYAGYMGVGGERLTVEQRGSARYFMAFLERGDRGRRLQIGIDLTTGTIGESELGWMAWQSVVPMIQRGRCSSRARRGRLPS